MTSVPERMYLQLVLLAVTQKTQLLLCRRCEIKDGIDPVLSNLLIFIDIQRKTISIREEGEFGDPDNQAGNQAKLP